MKTLSVSEVGERLATATRLKLRPLCIHGSEAAPADALPTTSLNRCVAEAIFALAVDKKTPALYVGGKALEDCCGGGTSYLGFTDRSPYIKYFVSYGTKEFRSGAAEYLRATPEIVEENAKRIGKITPPGRYVVIRPCSDLVGEDPGVRSILLFGEPEQIRHLCGLVHFRSVDPFDEVLAPSGPSCASFITYAAGMAERAPRNAAIIGPFDPTGNRWFPPELMSLALPIGLARRMCDDIPSSFLTKRRAVVFPTKRRSVRMPKRLIR
jgi:hypothetical protein